MQYTQQTRPKILLFHGKSEMNQLQIQLQLYQTENKKAKRVQYTVAQVELHIQYIIR